MNEGLRGGFREFWTRVLIAVCLIGAIAASLFARLSWRQYFRYVTAQFGWPFVAAILTAGVICVVALFAAKRRKASAILAVSMLVSVVLHMLTASVFRFVVVGNMAANVVPKENRPMVSFDLPSLSESILSQEVRAEFTVTTLPKPRRFETEKKTRTEPAEKRIARPQPQLKPKDMPDPAPQKAKPAFASKTEPAAREELAVLQARAPDVTQTKLTMLKPAPNAKEPPRPPRPAPKEMKPAPVSRVRLESWADTPAVALTASTKETLRDPPREQMKVAPQWSMEPRVQEVLRDTAIAATVDELKLPAVRTPSETDALPLPEPRLAPKRAFPVSDQAAQLMETPVSVPAARELITTVPKVDSVSFAEAAPAHAERQAATPTAEGLYSLPAGSRPLSHPDIVVEGAAATAPDSGSRIEGSPVVAPVGRHELATTKRQGIASEAEDRPELPKRPLGEIPEALSDSSLVSRSSVTGFDRNAWPAVVAQDILPSGNAADRERADAALAKLVPGFTQTTQADRPGKGSAEGGAAQPATDQTEMRVGKAAGKLADGGATVPPHGITSSISGISGGSAASRTAESSFSTASLGSPYFPALAPVTEARTHGVGQNTLSAIPGTPTAGLDPVALGLSGREATSPAYPSRETSAASSGPSALSEVRVTKAVGPAVPDTVPVGADLALDTSGLSLSASRPPARMDLALAGGSAAQTEVSAEISVGGGPGEAARTLITAELSAVPESVPEKAIYKLRAPERRGTFIDELGGSPQTEQAMERALVWLARAQSDDGRWDVDGFKTLAQCGGPGDRKDGDVALTGLCLLSYLGAGYTHVKGDHTETVRKALNWLVVGQKADGDLQRDGQMYGQAMATAALCEGYSMTGDQRLRGPVERAVDFILKAQNPGAGWRYLPRQDNDTSVTGWQVLALKSAMIAGIPFPPEHFQWVEAWLDKVRRGQEGGLYAYMPGHGATPTMTAEGWFCQLLMREQTRTRGQTETIPFLMAHPPVWSPKERTINLYYWYYATLALHMSGAAEFKQWNQALTQALLTGQVQSGPAAGSWDPVCVLGDRGGRVYATATAALCLEVYYRYLPFYKQK